MRGRRRRWTRLSAVCWTGRAGRTRLRCPAADPFPNRQEVRRASQRRHRDFNDRHLLEAFLYRVDVDEQTGPFEYGPRSAPGGELDELWPWRPLGENYPPEDEFANRIDGRSVTFTAPKG